MYKYTKGTRSTETDETDSNSDTERQHGQNNIFLVFGFVFFWLGEVDLPIIKMEINGITLKQEKCIKYVPEDSYNIRNYASRNGPIVSVGKVKMKFSKLNEPTASTLLQKFGSELSELKWRVLPSASTINRSINDMVQCYLVVANNWSAVILRAVGIRKAKALVSCYPHLIRSISIKSSPRAQSLFCSMGFVC